MYRLPLLVHVHTYTITDDVIPGLSTRKPLAPNHISKESVHLMTNNDDMIPGLGNSSAWARQTHRRAERRRANPGGWY